MCDPISKQQTLSLLAHINFPSFAGFCLRIERLQLVFFQPQKPPPPLLLAPSSVCFPCKTLPFSSLSARHISMCAIRSLARDLTGNVYLGAVSIIFLQKHTHTQTLSSSVLTGLNVFGSLHPQGFSRTLRRLLSLFRADSNGGSGTLVPFLPRTSFSY